MTRLSRLLEKHGLSFGDALNVALFVLTLAALGLAYQGVRLAKITLAEARAQAKDQDALAQEQMKQLRASTNALQTATTLLSEQSDTLRGLQEISRQQLANLNGSEARIRKHEQEAAAPRIVGACDEFALMDAHGKDIPAIMGGNQFNTQVAVRLRRDRTVDCFIRVVNEGDAELKNANFGITISDSTEIYGGDCNPDVFVAKVNDSIASSGRSMAIIVGATLPPYSKTRRFFEAHLLIRFGEKCRDFKIVVTLESDNFQRLEITTYASPIQFSRGPD